MYIDVAYGHVFDEMPTNNRIVSVHTSMGNFKSTSCGMGLWKQQHSMDCPEQTNSPPLVGTADQLPLSLAQETNTTNQDSHGDAIESSVLLKCLLYLSPTCV